jgi:hypothetical protein
MGFHFPPIFIIVYNDESTRDGLSLIVNLGDYHLGLVTVKSLMTNVTLVKDLYALIT